MPELAIILPAFNAADRVGVTLRNWNEKHPGVHWVVIDDGSSDDTPNVVRRMREKIPRITLLHHAVRRGFGACLRSGLREVAEPLVATLALDYPYQPSDLTLLLERLRKPAEIYGLSREITVASGCRTGVPIPAFWKRAGWCYRWGLRVALGFKPEPLRGWLGLQNHWRSWSLWLTMGVPLIDITTGLKLFRTNWLKEFPIQNDGDFAHAEVMAKLTFIGALVAEEALTPRSTPIPPTHFCNTQPVLRDARFFSIAHPAKIV